MKQQYFSDGTPIFPNRKNADGEAVKLSDCYTPEDVKKLVAYILDWWKDAQYDTTGPYGEYNVYDEEPSFVTKAKTLRERGV